MNQLKIKIQRHFEYMDNDTVFSNDEVIDELNKAEVERLIPLLAYLVIIIVAGILGNGLVCYIYRSKYDVSSSRWFIFFLGAMDLLLCVFIIPCEVATTLHQYNFRNAFFCQLSVFLNLWSLLSLGLTLVIVSIDRYRKVCKPLGWQINFEKAQVLCAVAVGLACCLALPVFGVYGIYEIKFKRFNVTAYECSFRKTEESNFAFWYVLFGMGLFCGALVVICVLYCFVGSEIKSHMHRENMKRQVSLSASMAPRNRISRPAEQSIKKIVRFTMAEPKPEPEQSEVKNVKFAQPQRHESTTSNETDEVSENNVSEDGGDSDEFEFKIPVVRTRLEKTKSRRVRTARARKATFSMFLISIAFVISYLPFLCLLMARSLNESFDETLSDAGRATYKFFLRSYFFNCAINPFIYGISDSRFRENCKGIICAILDHFRSRNKHRFGGKEQP